MHVCKILAASQAILYPAEFTADLWIENKGVASIFHNFLQSQAGAFKIF